MRLYAETSAVLSVLFAEPPAGLVLEELRVADAVVASALTLLETRRAIVRGEAIGALTEGRAADMLADLSAFSTNWSIVSVDDFVLERAQRRFPSEPIRSLDAIHLASALAIREAVGPIRILSLDERLRRSARELGFEVVPALGDTLHDR